MIYLDGVLGANVLGNLLGRTGADKVLSFQGALGREERRHARPHVSHHIRWVVDKGVADLTDLNTK